MSARVSAGMLGPAYTPSRFVTSSISARRVIAVVVDIVDGNGAFSAVSWNR